ncbi:MAG: HlyD family efflux transporter periplasmic adaptor subunit [Flavobacteriales bacterium]|nr:HlyD family efflux transporter periplasmic adaptor subunit [Flavobacteriales bacterium]
MRIWSSLFTILLVLGIVLFGSCSSGKEGIRPETSDLIESVYASVQVEPEGYYKVFAASTGIIRSIHVKEGDTVATGEVLATIDSDRADLQKSDAIIQAELARENYQGKAAVLSSLENEIASLEKQFSLDSTNFFRQKRLWEQKIGSKSDFEQAELRYDRSLNSLDRARKNFIQKKNELESNYRRALLALDRAETSLDEFSITSRMDGMVYSILKEEGESLGSMEALAQLGSSTDFILKMSIDEVDIARVEVGQQAYITLDAYPGEVFQAELSRIDPMKDERTQTFEVEARFITPPPRLYAGLTGEANITIRTIEDVLHIPLAYLTADDKVITDEGEIEVEIGLRNLDRVQILSGLDSTSTLYLPD